MAKHAFLLQALKNKSLEALEEKLQYCEDVNNLMDLLDPGVTMHKAFILKTTAMTRMELVKSIKSNNGGDQEKSILQTKKALEELKLVAVCLKSRKP